MRVKYLGDKSASDAVVKWGSNDDPRGLLVEGQFYEVENIDVRSMHTKIILKDFPNKRFNSVSFEEQE